MAIATLVVSAAAVVGVKAYNYYSLSPLMKANLEALSVTEFNGVPVYQTMAKCNGVMMLACTTVKYARVCLMTKVRKISTISPSWLCVKSLCRR